MDSIKAAYTLIGGVCGEHLLYKTLLILSVTIISNLPIRKENLTQVSEKICK